MTEAFRLGGWGMYPTAIAGLFLLATAALYARNPEHRRLQVVRVLSLLVFLSGCLGFITGVIKSFAAAGKDPEGELGMIVVTGVGESLHNIGLALCLIVIATILRAVGVARAGSPEAALHDPHS